MINIDTLKQVRTIVVHQNSPGSPCPDGTASAIILRDALPDARIVFASYDQLGENVLPVEPGILFCDITPPPDRAPAFVEAGAIVLDHHEKAKDTVELFGVRGIYANQPGYSGAMLAVTEVWASLKSDVNQEFYNAHHFAHLAGVRDTWWKDHENWERSCEQAEALRFWPWDEWPLDPFSSTALTGQAFEIMLVIGRTLRKKKLAKDADIAKNAWPMVSQKGTRVAVISTTKTSDVADLVDADILVGFKYHPDFTEPRRMMLTLSMRSRSLYDVGDLAKSLGGGGHKFAAGATLPPDSNHPWGPYARIMQVINAYEEAR